MFYRRNAYRAAWFLIAYAATYEAIAGWIYVTADPEKFDLIFRAKYIAYLPLVVTHGTCSIVALACGPWQFVKSLRERCPRLHRRMGMAYLAGVLVGSLTGLAMATMAEGGLSARIGFVLMSCLWFFTGGMAWITARRRNFAAHRAWMVRNFALTFGAVMLRIYLHGLERMGFEFHQVYGVTTWLGWVPNLLVAELLLRVPDTIKCHL